MPLIRNESNNFNKMRTPKSIDTALQKKNILKTINDSIDIMFAVLFELTLAL